MIDVDETIFAAAVAVLRDDRLSRVIVEPTIDSEGDDAWQVTIVLRSDDVSGKEAFDTIVGIRRALVTAGDEQFPIIDFATEDELAADVDPES